MTITQIVEIPADRRIILEVPSEVTTESVVLTLTPTRSETKPRITEEEEKEYINRHADRLNAEAMDALSYQVALWDDDEE